MSTVSKQNKHKEGKSYKNMTLGQVKARGKVNNCPSAQNLQPFALF